MQKLPFPCAKAANLCNIHCSVAKKWAHNLTIWKFLQGTLWLQRIFLTQPTMFLSKATKNIEMCHIRSQRVTDWHCKTEHLSDKMHIILSAKINSTIKNMSSFGSSVLLLPAPTKNSQFLTIWQCVPEKRWLDCNLRILKCFLRFDGGALDDFWWQVVRSVVGGTWDTNMVGMAQNSFVWLGVKMFDVMRRFTGWPITPSS